MKPVISLAALGAAALAATSSAAQAQSSDSGVIEVIVFGTDPCPRSTDDEIVVCRRLPAEERYRIPRRFREGGAPQQRQSWASRARSLETVGRTGINSCSPVGPGGHTGCLEQLIRQTREAANADAQASTPPPETPDE